MLQQLSNVLALCLSCLSLCPLVFVWLCWLRGSRFIAVVTPPPYPDTGHSCTFLFALFFARYLTGLVTSESGIRRILVKPRRRLIYTLPRQQQPQQLSTSWAWPHLLLSTPLLAQVSPAAAATTTQHHKGHIHETPPLNAKCACCTHHPLHPHDITQNTYIHTYAHRYCV